MATAFETALAGRVAAMLDACTRCGKCVEACPVTDAAGVAAAPVAVIGGIIDILREGEGTPEARRWATSCVLSGACIAACDEGVNPRFLLAMARVALAKEAAPTPERRRRGFDNFRKVAREVGHLSRLQLDEALLARLGQGGTENAAAAATEPPDFVFHTGCNVLKTPHIALLCLDIMDALGVSYRVMGGPSHCCGILQMRTGDLETSGRVAESAIDKLAQSRTGEVISWCPTCQVQFTENALPTVEKMRGARPFEMTPFMRFLHARLDRLRPLLAHAVPLRVALHRHPGVPGVAAAAEALLRAVPGVELVELGIPAVGLQSNALAPLPELRRELQRRELEAAEEAGVDALAAVYHTDHRELCAHERDWPFRIVNVLEVIGASMGLHHDDGFKRLKLMQDVDAVMEACADLLARHRLDAAAARESVAAMLAEQPLPLARRRLIRRPPGATTEST